jgi:hypothetical protein
MGADLLSAAERKSTSDDKFVHITAGYYHLVDGDFYMNQLASARPHWWYLSDSNVEWGDDVKALARYLKARGETQVQGALSGAWGTIHHYGVRQLDLIAPAAVVARYPRTRYTAIGASFLNGSTVPGGDEGYGQGHGAQRVNKFAAYRDRPPEAVFGRSIYLYREH